MAINILSQPWKKLNLHRMYLSMLTCFSVHRCLLKNLELYVVENMYWGVTGENERYWGDTEMQKKLTEKYNNFF